jgi:hypothetical protein
LDLAAHGRVLWRFRVLVVCGLVLAALLAFLSYFRVTTHGLSYRQNETWQSSEVLLLAPIKGNCLLDPNAPLCTLLPSLSPLYAQLANSAIIRKQVFPTVASTKNGNYISSAVPTPNNSTATLPFLEINGQAISAQRAVAIAKRASAVLLSYLRATPARTIPETSRVVAQVVTEPSIDQATVVQGRKKTLPIVIFLAVIGATIALVYVLQNLRTPSAASLPTLGNHDGSHAQREPSNHQPVKARGGTVADDPTRASTRRRRPRSRS